MTTMPYTTTIIMINPINLPCNSAVKPPTPVSAGVITSSTRLCIYTEDTKPPTELNTMQINTKSNCHL